MTEKPILFSGDTVRAILDGRKTQTRRVISDKILKTFQDLNPDIYGNGVPSFETEMGQEVSITNLCPYGQVGDRLWVRETWADIGYAMFSSPHYVYRATDHEWEKNDGWRGWKPSIHMPRQASRITLKIINVRVERLQDIHHYDAIAEGVMSSNPCGGCGENQWNPCIGCLHPFGDNPVDVFSNLWDSINAKKHPWDSNPWVWVIEFKRVDS